jgi:hypothetical protein
MSLRASRTITLSSASEPSKLGLSRTARLFVPSYRSRSAIRIHPRLAPRPDTQSESPFAWFDIPRRRWS